jgi:hypothetical protein
MAKNNDVENFLGEHKPTQSYIFQDPVAYVPPDRGGGYDQVMTNIKYFLFAQ